MKIKVVVFPGSNCDHDTQYAFGDLLKHDVEMLWHKETNLGDCDMVILPGGFAFGDYLRTGVMARYSPVMPAVESFANSGGPVLGICNGFQVLCEAGLLPGALMKNACLQFRCAFYHMRVETTNSPFTSHLRQGQILSMPIAHGDGNYFVDADTLRDLIDSDCVLLRYTTGDGLVTPDSNPNGSIYNIAAICNKQRNVIGLMPHPERAVETVLGSSDGMLLLEGYINRLQSQPSSVSNKTFATVVR